MLIKPEDPWLNRSHISYLMEERVVKEEGEDGGDTITLLILRVHGITTNMGGKYK